MDIILMKNTVICIDEDKGIYYKSNRRNRPGS